MKILCKNVTLKDKIVLLQGENGRNFIENKLKIKGFNISLIECYKRVLKKIDIDKETEKWRLYGINTFIITNGETLKELKKIISNNYQTKWLLTCKIFVVGERLFSLAHQFGWKKIIMSHYANNNFLLNIVQEHFLNN